MRSAPLKNHVSFALIITLMGGLISAEGVMAQARAPAASPAAKSDYDRAPWWMRDNVITQIGSVYVELPSNRAQFNAQFQTVGETIEQAQSRAIDKTKALNGALSKLGKEAVRVNTTFSMRTLYDQYRDKQGNLIENQRGDKIDGYQVNLGFDLQVRDLRVLEKAYALVLAASPTSTSNINYSLNMSNESNAWLYGEAVKDARSRALSAASGAGAVLSEPKVIDPTARACETDILGRQSYGSDGIMPNEVHLQARDMAYAAPPPPMMAMAREDMDAVEELEAKALKNAFIQTPPIHRMDSRACVVFGLK
jgi:uncharacterized protein YggE